MTDRVSRSRADEEGFTLVEMIVTMMLLGVVLAMVAQVMISTQTQVQLETGRSARNDRLGLAIRAIERDLRSGEVVADPSAENDAANGIVPGMSFRVRTEVNAASSSSDRCRQWRIAGGKLQSRSWSPAWRTDLDVNSWSVAADGIANADASPAVAAFRISTDPNFAGQVVEVRLLARPDSSETKTQRVETSITSRNARFGARSTRCDDLPPY
jgi:prepilin-type N-terminal cleavage/methylation domain-containing protein